MAEGRSVHVSIHGRVQGVGFRAWVHHQAELHGLKGWVRNRRDGTVEAMFSGPDHLVDAMLQACHQGPRGASVERVEPLEGSGEDQGPFTAFKVLETR